MRRLILVVTAVLMLLVIVPADAAPPVFAAKARGVLSVNTDVQLVAFNGSLIPATCFPGADCSGLSASWRFTKSLPGLSSCSLARRTFKTTAYFDWSNGASSVAPITVLFPSDPLFVWVGRVTTGLFAGKRFTGILVPTDPIRLIRPSCQSKLTGVAAIA